MSNPSKISLTKIAKASDAAARAIPPVWPLASSVAVNPYLGQTGETLAETGARLGRVAGVAVTMPRAHYAGLIAEGAITDQDILDVIAASADAQGLDLEAVKRLAGTEAPAPTPQPTVADLAAQVSGLDWPGIIADRFGLWAAGYFDQGQALWAAPRRRGAYDAWRQYATHDLTPEIAGLKGFAQFVSETPDTADEAKRQALGTLGLPEAALETYLHKLLFTLGGWGQVGRYHLWQAELAGATDDTLTDLLTIRLLWEEALFAQYGDRIAALWADVIAAHEAPVTIDADFAANAILQEAWERAVQRGLAETFAAEAVAEHTERPALQVGFCIDVRSEVFRRALESLDPSIQTIGFAGFFGLTTAHKGFASDVEELRLPVLLNPGVSTVSGTEAEAEADQNARFKARAKRAWGRFKLAAVSSFAFVEATGPIYAGKLVKDALGLERNKAPNDPAPRLDPALDLAARIDAAETVLRAMSLTGNYARLILMAGHGANVVNNPHASGLHCGACGGYSGEVNARLLAALLNDPEVRQGLIPRGIEIPSDTLFVGALHDTTTDAVTLYADDHASPDHTADLKQAKAWLASAGKITRGERA